MVHLGDSFVLWLMWFMSSLKASCSSSQRPPPLSPAAAWMKSQLHIDQAKCAFGSGHKPLPNAVPLQAPHSEFLTLFLVKGPGLKCPLQPRRSCSRTSPFFCTKEERGPGFGAPLCRTHPAFSALCPPLMRVFKWWFWLLFLSVLVRVCT